LHTKRRKEATLFVVDDRINSRTPDTSHRLEASMMNAETALGGRSPRRVPSDKGGSVPREGDRGGEERFVTVLT